MKKSKGFHCIISILLILAVIATPVWASTEPSIGQENTSPDETLSGCFSADATDAFLGSGQLVKNAKSVFLYELHTQTLMYAWEPDLKLSPSSFVKILTAIVAIENGDLNSAITVTETVLSSLPTGAVSTKLQVNEVLTLKDLLYCMLVGSGNDAAAVIANHIGGGQLKFVEMMNAFAADLGCTDSYFTNPHGLHDQNQVTTARDTVKILEYAMRNETFRTIFSATEYAVPATNKSAERYLVTGNYMMSTDEVEIYFDERVIGGRTGVSNDGARCLATVATSGSMELICVVMGASSAYEEGGNKIRSFGGYNETKELLNAGFNGNNVAQILYDGQALRQYDLPNADTLLTVGPHDTVSTVLPENATMADISFRFNDEGNVLNAPICAGDKVCSVEVWYNGLLLAVTDLYAMNSVRSQSAIRLLETESRGYIPVIVAFAVVLILLVGAFVLFRTRYGRRFLMQIRRRWRRSKRRK